MDTRNVFIDKVARGNSFVDIGGLWGTSNEKVSVASSAGSTLLAMADITPFGEELWSKFNDRMASLNISGYECFELDLARTDADQNIPKFDVVHCSGVLYHCPNPVLVLENLRKISSKYVILTSVITAEKVGTSSGNLEILPCSPVFVPALSESEREILNRYWSEIANSVLGITQEVEFKSDNHRVNFAPWWWLFTETSLVAMCRAAGLELIESGYNWNGNSCTLLLRPFR